jgi:predicted nucleotidyltransferase
MENLKNIELLKVPDGVKKDLREFLEQVIKFYSDDLISIMAFGSSTTGDYAEASSDVNLMVVYSDLNIADLDSVAKLSRSWLKKRSFSPRFISLNNLKNSAKFFQIDMLEMKDMHITLYGEDLLNSMQINKSNLHWQLSYEIKAMRMRIKQQFWRSCGDDRLMTRILLERFTSIIHLSKVLLYLMDKPVAPSFDGILSTSAEVLGIPSSYIEKMKALKQGKSKIDSHGLTQLFTELMEVIRIIDNKSDQIANEKMA